MSKPASIVAWTIALLIAAPALAQAAKPQIHHTIPQPPKIKPADPNRVLPGFEVPQNPDAFTWKVTNKINGKAVSAGNVPVFGFNSMGRGSRIGEIADGTVLKITNFRQVAGMILYEIPFTSGPGGIGYVDGRYIAAAGSASPAK